MHSPKPTTSTSTNPTDARVTDATLPPPGRCYAVGGCVRDALLGRPVVDRDWVVTGSTPQAMVDAGFKPVGRDFPVFLHPLTHDEYALARTERKSAPGYRGFTFHTGPGVTLEQDLARRDLTINAIAQDDAGRLIDPFGGQRDLAAKLLRHVSPAFAEDPVRLLRVARFAARFAGFAVAPETQVLLKQLVDGGEVNALVPERVWQEVARGLMEAQPSRMLQVLADCGALARLASGVDLDLKLPQVLDLAAQVQAPLPVRWACLAAAAADLGAQLKPPSDCAELASAFNREAASVHASAALDAAGLVQLLERCDAIRRPQRMAELLLACECDARGRGLVGGDYAPRQRLAIALQSALGVDTASVALAAAARGLAGPAVGDAVRQARIAAVAGLG